MIFMNWERAVADVYFSMYVNGNNYYSLFCVIYYKRKIGCCVSNLGSARESWEISLPSELGEWVLFSLLIINI